MQGPDSYAVAPPARAGGAGGAGGATAITITADRGYSGSRAAGAVAAAWTWAHQLGATSAFLFAVLAFAGSNKAFNYIPDIHNELAEQFEAFTPVVWGFLGLSAATFMKAVGFAEVALGVAGVALPGAKRVAASILACILAGATYTHLAMEDGRTAPAAFLCGLSVYVAAGYDQSTAPNKRD